MKIYTKSGDAGETSLLGGTRVLKDDPRVSACGDVDELNAAIGLTRSLSDGELDRFLARIQRDLFAIGARLADPGQKVAQRRHKAAVTAAHVRRLERAIDRRQAGLPSLRAFVLPGGAPAAALLHLARAVCRRAERSVVGLARRSPVDPRIVSYLNRLSDLLFVLARAENRRARQDEDRW